MSMELRDIEPFYGWLNLYSHEQDEHSPFHDVEHNQFYFDRSINHIPAHPLWDDFGSESLLLKILFVDYQEGYAIIELFGEWNDLFDNDFKLLRENCLSYLLDYRVDKFILVCENVFHIYPEADDYYQAMYEELEEGWMCLLRPRPHVREEMEQYGIVDYFYVSDQLDAIPWRRQKPQQLYRFVSSRMPRLLS